MRREDGPILNPPARIRASGRFIGCGSMEWKYSSSRSSLEPMTFAFPLMGGFRSGWAYFESTRQDPRERQIYRVRLNGMEIQQLTKQPGTHDLRLSPDGRFLVDDFSSITDPPETRLLKSDGTYLSTLDKPANHLSNYALGLTELVSIKAADGTTLYARLVRPANFNPQKKYPVIVYVYGGPHFQIVRNEWGTTSLLDQLLAEHGFLIWSLDNRGSWGRGHAFETVV